MSEDREDRALKALFADAPRPAWGDETFVAGVMARVEAHEAKKKSRWNAALFGGLGLMAGFVALNYGEVIGAFYRSVGPLAADVPQLGAGGLTALLALAAAGAGWAYSER